MKPASSVGNISTEPALASAELAANKAPSFKALSDEALLLSLAHWAYQFTPSVCLHRPRGLNQSGIFLEVAPSLRLFGGLSALCTRLLEGLETLGYPLSYGVSLTASSAWWLAKYPSTQQIRITERSALQSLLPSLPVSVLDQAHPHLKTLESCGIRSIGELLQLPRDGIARRFGPAVLTEIDQAFAWKPEVHVWVEPPPVFQMQREMPFHTTHIAGLLRCAEQLLIPLCLWLQGRRAATRRLQWRFKHSHDFASERSVRSAEPQNNVQAWLQLLQDELTRQPLTKEACDIALNVTELEADINNTGSLFPGQQEQAQAWGQLLNRLQARLGAERTQCIASQADARPEKAHRQTALELSAPQTTRKYTENTVLRNPLRLPRPLWLLEKPSRLRLEKNMPCQQGKLCLLAGPERIQFGWWDGSATVRDYFIAQDIDQSQLWVYREIEPETQRLRWYLQGLFA